MTKTGGGIIRKLSKFITMGVALVALAACDPTAITSGGRGGKAQVALLVPSGSADGNVAFLAQSLVNAAKLAVADLEGTEIDLRVYDTAGNANQAANMARNAVAEGADVIVGPLFAEAAAAVGVAVAGTNTAVLSFSNNGDIAGGNVFVLGATFDNTARRMMGYAKKQGIDSVMVVNGQTTAEQIGRDAIVRAAQDYGIRIAGSESFAMSQEGVVAAAPRIVAQTQASGASALFLTSNTDTALPIITQLLPEQGLTPESIQYIGLTRWDVPASALALPGVQGGWFALPDTQALNQFSSRYSTAFGAAPHSIAGLGYDGIAAVGALAGSNNGLSPSSFTQSRGFAGASGVFRFLQNGSNQRALSVATIQNKAVRILDPAPKSFGAAGF
ncbi:MULTISPECIES: penicillin-binding protein activator [unclassified Meridianimarinicoccus]|uniref:penicillin-binding protein activator n=1 Tax=unclassified Meridianimarinicoccus TaxID=2923344 RepID=UPI0018696820|nr:penicillin-binding protein activator [Fluviibacterium sp. MJW13]